MRPQPCRDLRTRYSDRGRGSSVCKGPEVGMLKGCLKVSRCEDGTISASVWMGLQDNRHQSHPHFQLRHRDHPSMICKRGGKNGPCHPKPVSYFQLKRGWKSQERGWRRGEFGSGDCWEFWEIPPCQGGSTCPSLVLRVGGGGGGSPARPLGGVDTAPLGARWLGMHNNDTRLTWELLRR